MSYNTSEDGSMGCLADIAGEFCGIPERTVDMYSGLSFSAHMFPQEKETLGNLPAIYTAEEVEKRRDYRKGMIKEAVLEVMQDMIPEDTYDTTFKDMAETGEVVLSEDMTCQLAHTRLAPFRNFIENTDSMWVYQELKEYSVRGAFIASHLCSIDYFGSLCKGKPELVDSSGWHQSMFPGINREGICCQANVRRVAAFYRWADPLFEKERLLEKHFCIPDLKQNVYAGALEILNDNGLYAHGDSLLPSVTEDQEAFTKDVEVWFDCLTDYFVDCVEEKEEAA